MKLENSFFDSAEGFGEQFVGGGVGEADALGRHERRARDSSHVRFREEVHRQIVAVCNGFLALGRAVMLAEEAVHFGEEVERTVGHGHFESRDFARQTHHEVTSALEGLAHLADAVLRARVGGLRSFHRDGATAAGVLALQLLAGLDDPGLRGHPADTPARHRVGFADAVDEDDALLQFGELREREMLADVVDMLVDLVVLIRLTV